VAVETPAPLAPQDAARLTELARAFKAAARAVVLYPAAHPAIAATLGRIVSLTADGSLTEPLRIGVLADGLLVDGRAPARVDPAITELATLLHEHLIGELTIHPGGDLDAWRGFLMLLGRTPEAVRAEGGIARLWTTMAGRHVEIREIDYAEVLRERTGGEAAAWDQVIANCLQGDAFDLNEETIRVLLAAATDSEKIAQLVTRLDERAAESGRNVGQRTTALLKLLQAIVQAVSEREPERIEPVLRNLAGAAGRLSPDMLVALISRGEAAPSKGGDTRSDSVGGTAVPALVSSVMNRIGDPTIAQFVARNALSPGTSIERVAQAFHALVRDVDRRERLIAMAHDDAMASPLGTTEGFEQAWETVAQKMMTSYSDKPFVSDEYARELSGSRTRAIDIEQLKDDPPERLTAWLGTVATTELRKLDLTLVFDLLRIETDTARWAKILPPVVSLIEDLLLVGDFDAAADLVAAVLLHTSTEAAIERRQTALTAIDRLVKGPMMRHIVTHLATVDESQFERVKTMSVSVGDVIIRPLAEALAAEERARPRERLTSILIAFGASGRREVERLKNSPNAAVRRTAIYLLREFGGSDALPELTELLKDNEQQVQREAVRAILRIGTDSAYRVLEQALTSGTEQSREMILQALTLVRDERATPLFSFILTHVDHRGQLGSIYMRAIEALGALKDPEGVPALKSALYRGEWWAPRRTAALRAAAAQALARIAAPEALAALEEAASSATRGVRAAARAQLASGRAARPAPPRPTS
jgi:HEAT repeat protein